MLPPGYGMIAGSRKKQAWTFTSLKQAIGSGEVEWFVGNAGALWRLLSPGYSSWFQQEADQGSYTSLKQAIGSGEVGWLVGNAGCLLATAAVPGVHR